MEELQVAPLNASRTIFWSNVEGIRALLPPPSKGIHERIELVYQESIVVVVRWRSTSGGIAPSFRGIWQLILISEPGPEQIQVLSSVSGATYLIREIQVECDQVETLLGVDVVVRVIVPEAMWDPRHPPPEFLIHVEGERK